MPWYRIPPNMAERVADPALKALYEGREGEGGGVVHINFGSGRNRHAPSPCKACGWISDRLCDWKLASGRDCNAPICGHCSFSPAPGKDLCPVHVNYYRRWLVEQLIPLT